MKRRREAGEAARQLQEERLGLLYEQDGDEETRTLASEQYVREVVGGVSASFVGPWS